MQPISQTYLHMRKIIRKKITVSYSEMHSCACWVKQLKPDTAAGPFMPLGMYVQIVDRNYMARSNKFMPHSDYIFLAFIFYFTLEIVDFLLSITELCIKISAFWTCVPMKCYLSRSNAATKGEKCTFSYWNTNIGKVCVLKLFHYFHYTVSNVLHIAWH